jgi:UDP-glucose 4-epimerase
MKVLLIGGSGFIGRSIERQASQRGWLVDAPPTALCDLAAWESVDGFLQSRTSSFDALVLAAGPRGGLRSPADFQAAALAAVNAELLARALAPRTVVFLSSVDVYGRPPVECPVRETTPLRPDTIYAATKIYTENVLSVAAHEANSSLLVFRLPGVFGLNDNSPRIVARLLRSSGGGPVVCIPGDGSQRRDLVWVEDVARLILEGLSQAMRPGVYNLVSGQSLSVRDIVEGVRAAGWDPSIEYGSSADDQYDLIFAADKLQTSLPGFQFTAMQDALRR